MSDARERHQDAAAAEPLIGGKDAAAAAQNVTIEDKTVAETNDHPMPLWFVICEYEGVALEQREPAWPCEGPSQRRARLKSVVLWASAGRWMQPTRLLAPSTHTHALPTPSNPPAPPAASVYYTLASGTLLVINKVAIVALPAPTFVLLAQLVFSAAAVLAAHWVGAIAISPATNRQLMHFLPVVAAFLGTIYANMKVLQHSNVETFITFRSSTPLVLAFCDYAFLGRALPSGRSWFALGALLLSSAGYAWFDRGFVINAYIWLLIWYVFFTFEGVWVKHMVSGSEEDGRGRVQRRSWSEEQRAEGGTTCQTRLQPGGRSAADGNGGAEWHAQLAAMLASWLLGA